MQNILIVDAGSTTSSWVYLYRGKKQTATTPGYNPTFHKAQDFTFPNLKNLPDCNEVYYYGSGVIDEKDHHNLRLMLMSRITNAQIYIDSDLVAAARATLFNHKGGIGILGTGSNSAYYDGQNINLSIPSLGYMLGDEGGGVDLGKRIIRSYFYRKMPAEVADVFVKKYPFNREEFLNNLSNNPFPNQYLASFVSILKDVSGNWKKNLLLDSFSGFFAVRKNDFIKTEKNCFVGSIAWVFESELKEAAALYNIEISKIIKEPITGLLKYHIEKNHGKRN